MPVCAANLKKTVAVMEAKRMKLEKERRKLNYFILAILVLIEILIVISQVNA